MTLPRSLASILGLTLLASLAVAQTAPPAPGSAERNVTLTITPAEVALLGKGLGMLPYNEVAQLFAKLQGQIATQQGAAPPTPGSEAPK